MKHFDAIRGREPTKTELILDYLLNRPDEVLTPKEVAEGLGFNLQTTVTVLNRLAMESAISKKGRGQFCYEAEEKGEMQPAGGNETKGPDSSLDPKIDTQTAVIIYNGIYDMASESMGAEVVGSMTGLGPEDFDKKAPLESIRNLIRTLIDFLGKEIADDIVSIVLEGELAPEKERELKHFFERLEESK